MPLSCYRQNWQQSTKAVPDRIKSTGFPSPFGGGRCRSPILQTCGNGSFRGEREPRLGHRSFHQITPHERNSHSTKRQPIIRGALALIAALVIPTAARAQYQNPYYGRGPYGQQPIVPAQPFADGYMQVTPTQPQPQPLPIQGNAVPNASPTAMALTAQRAAIEETMNPIVCAILTCLAIIPPAEYGHPYDGPIVTTVAKDQRELRELSLPRAHRISGLPAWRCTCNVSAHDEQIRPRPPITLPRLNGNRPAQLASLNGDFSTKSAISGH